MHDWCGKGKFEGKVIPADKGGRRKSPSEDGETTISSGTLRSEPLSLDGEIEREIEGSGI
jgi:hypothetical protein